MSLYVVLIVGVCTTGVPEVAAMGAVLSSLTKITLDVMVSPEGTEKVGVIWMAVPVVTVPVGEVDKLKLAAKLGGETTVTVRVAVPVSIDVRTVVGS